MSEGQGRIARRGAVSAAIKAGDYDRAQTLEEAYIADEAAPHLSRSRYVRSSTKPIKPCQAAFNMRQST